MLFTTAFLSTLVFSGAAYAQQGGNGPQAPQDPQPAQNGQAPQDPQPAQNGQAPQGTETPVPPQTPETATAQDGETPQGMVNVHVVQVSNAEGSKKFYPESLQANAGEMVQFQFHPMNHSVVQSDFSAPCTPISETKPDVAGVKSGFMPVEMGAKQMPVWTMMINNTDPMWLFCGAEGHCQNGMVMAINAAEDGEKTLDSFKTAAANAESGAGDGAAGDGAAGDGAAGDGAAGDGAAGNGAAGNEGDAANGGNAGGDAGGNADGAGADATSGAEDAAASGSPTSSGAPVSTGGASSTQTMSGAGLAGLFIACAAFVGL